MAEGGTRKPKLGSANQIAIAERYKDEGNVYFRSGCYTEALGCYEEALRIVRSPIYSSNLAAAYLKLEQFESAAAAATDALDLDPRSIKARYRRAVARKNLNLLKSAYIDIQTILRAEPDNAAARVEYESIMTLMRSDRQSDDAGYDTSDCDKPHFDDDKLETVSVSDLSDADVHHTGNGIPCRFYNHSRCARGDECKFSHAPDEKSVRDTVGKNVCLDYIQGRCKLSARNCAYSHSKDFLPARKDSDDAKSEDDFKPVSPDAFILLLSLEKESYFESSYSHVLSALRAKTPVRQALFAEEALEHLSSSNLRGVFVTDAGIIQPEHRSVLKKLVEFTKAGGPVVLGGHFSGDAGMDEFDNFFRSAWGLPWRSGDYHRSTFIRNSSNEVVKRCAASLAASCSMKALHVKGITPEMAVYKPTETSRTQSMVFPSMPVDVSQAPVVYSPVGNGSLGYIGDVNTEKEAANMLLAMLGFLQDSDSPSPLTEGSTGTRKIVAPSQTSFVFLLSLEHQKFFEDIYSSFLQALRSKTTVHQALTSKKALEYLSSPNLRAVFVTDPGITNNKSRATLTKLIEFAKNGGAVVIGALFCTFVRMNTMDKFFCDAWGVPWIHGDYHRTTFTRNPSNHIGKQFAASLALSYSMKALHVKGITPEMVVYRPTEASRTQSMVFAAAPVDLSQTPVAWMRYGEGSLAYVGDVNAEEESTNVVLAMLGLLN